jgi:hypothetical protein
MTRIDVLRHELTGRPAIRSKMQARSSGQERNHPVPVDEFDRERMGIASKE